MSHAPAPNAAGRPVHAWPIVDEGLQTLRARKTPFELHVFRHARTTHNDSGLVTGSSDVPLSAEGRASARAMSRRMPPRIDLVVCSGLSRTQETAILALEGRTDVTPPFVADARLDEVCLGVLEGCPRGDVPEYRAGDVDHAPPRGESYRTAARRVMSAVAGLGRLVPDGGSPATVVAFSHAGVMRILATLVGGSWTSRAMFEVGTGNEGRILLRSEAMSRPGFWTEGMAARTVGFATSGSMDVTGAVTGDGARGGPMTGRAADA